MKIPFVFKKCSKCGRWLVANTVNFGKNKDGKYGLNSQCKECKSAYNKKYTQEHKEEKREYDKKYNEQNKEKIAEYGKNYYEEHKEERREYDKKRYKENIEDQRKRGRKWYHENIEHVKNYREEHKEKIAEYHKKYKKTPQGQVVSFNAINKRRQRAEQQGNGITKDQWLEMMKFFGFKCAYSGITLNADTRSIDHIISLAKGGEHEVWNCVPMDRSLNCSKQEKDLEEWYPQQDFYSEDRLNKINEWREYAYSKWSNDEIQKTI